MGGLKKVPSPSVEPHIQVPTPHAVFISVPSNPGQESLQWVPPYPGMQVRQSDPPQNPLYMVGGQAHIAHCSVSLRITSHVCFTSLFALHVDVPPSSLYRVMSIWGRILYGLVIIVDSQLGPTLGNSAWTKITSEPTMRTGYFLSFSSIMDGVTIRLETLNTLPSASMYRVLLLSTFS